MVLASPLDITATCSMCGTMLPVDQFYVSKGKRHAACRKCSMAASMRWAAEHPDKSKKYLRTYRERNREKIRAYNASREERNYEIHIKNTYDVDLAWYQDKLAEQGGVCAICGCLPGRRRLCVDHSHVTGENRGLLCTTCNTTVQVFEADNTRSFAMVAYLQRHKCASLTPS